MARIGLVPNKLLLSSGGTGVTTVQIDNVSNLYGVELHVKFDPAIVQVDDAVPSLPGTQIGVGKIFSGLDVAIAQNEVNNTTGVIDFVVSLRYPAGAFAGTDSIAVIKWRAKSVGKSPITFSQTKLVSKDAWTIQHSTQNGAVEVTSNNPTSTPTPTPGPISGVNRVLLQGRSNHSGTTVYLMEDVCPSVQNIAALGLSNVVSADTNAQGNFELVPVPGRTYQCMLAVHDMYLVARRSAPFDNAGTVTLLGGDATADRIVNIFDLARLANAIGGADSTVDINGDGRVDVFDLTIAAGNFGKEGPLSW